MTSRSEPREQFEAALSALTESQRREVRLLARPFEWTALEIGKGAVRGWTRLGPDKLVVFALNPSGLNSWCIACFRTKCKHALALQTLYYGGHPMVTIVDRQGDDR